MKDVEKTLRRLLTETKDEELDCEAFQARLAADVEGTLEETFAALMEHHRRICPECDEEREILKRALGLD